MFIIALSGIDLSNLFNKMVCGCTQKDYDTLHNGFKGVDFMSDECISHKVTFATLQCYLRVMHEVCIERA